MSTDEIFCLPANPDVSGIGVRTAIYAQNFLSFIPAFYALVDGQVTVDELNSIEAQSSTILITALAILISAIVEGATHKLSNVHMVIILNLSWMNNTNLFIYFLLYLHHTAGRFREEALNWKFWWIMLGNLLGRVHSIPGDLPNNSMPNLGDGSAERNKKLRARGEQASWLNWILRLGKSRLRHDSEHKSPDKFIVTLGIFHLTLMAAVGLWLWSNPLGFDDFLQGPCQRPSLVILGSRVPITSSILQGFSIFMYSLVLVPLLNVFIPMAMVILFYIQFLKRYPEQPPISTVFGKVVSLLSLNNPFGNKGPVTYKTFPISVCLYLLAGINVLFVVDTEVTIHANKELQYPGESDWTFGQTLALLLLLLPLRDVLENFVKRQEGKVRGRIELALEANSKLIEAIEVGHLSVVKRLVEDGADMDQCDKDGKTVVHWAAIHDHLQFLQYLGSKGANLNAQDQRGTTPLMWATLWGHDNIVKYLVDKGAQLDLKDEIGYTSLSQAVLHGHSNIVKCLVDKGAQIDLQNKGGATPLLWATKKGNTDLVKYLGDKGAQLDLQDKNGHIPLVWAASMRHDNIVKYLVDKGAQLDLKDGGGNTSLLWAAKKGSDNIVEYLGNKGAQLDLQNENNDTPLWWAAKNGHKNIVKYLVDKGAQLDIQGEGGNTPLLCATKGGHEDIVKYLVDKGAQLDLPDDDGNTPLSWATLHGHDNIVTYLVNIGA